MSDEILLMIAGRAAEPATLERREFPDVEFLVVPPGAALDALAPLVDGIVVHNATHRLGAPPEAFPRCRVVVRAGVGYDTLDLAGWGARGVPACNVPDYGTAEVADHAIALMLALTRGTAAYHDALLHDRTWSHAVAPLVRRLRGAVFGVLGLGRIGLAAARRAAGFGMRVVFFDPYLPSGTELAVGYDRAPSLGALMAQSDVLSVHAPLNDETRGMIGAEALAQAKPGLILVNTARGPIVDLDALTDALRAARIGGAALDVLPVEPADPNHPLIAAWRVGEDWVRGRLTLSPHAAFYSPDAEQDLRRKAVQTVLAWLRDGRLLNCVNATMLVRD